MKGIKTNIRRLVITLVVITLIAVVFSTISLSEEETEWEIEVEFATTESYSNVFFGEAVNATDGQDSFDIPKPPAPPAPYLYAFLNAGLDPPYNKLWYDIREYPDDEKIWDLVVKSSDTDIEVTISWNSVLVQDTEYNTVKLVNLQNDDEVNMGIEETYTYITTGTDYFEIRCSNVEVITELTDEWNMISVPFQYAINKEDVNVLYDGTVYTWEEAVNNDYITNAVFIWNRGIQQYEEVDVFEPGQGYWMHALVECTLQT